jgi:hypothetical protein
MNAGAIFLCGLAMVMLMLTIYAAWCMIDSHTGEDKDTGMGQSYLDARRVMTDEYGWLGGNAPWPPRSEDRKMGEMYSPEWQPFRGWTRIGITELAEDWRKEQESPKRHRVYSDGYFMVEDHWPTCLRGDYIGMCREEDLKCPRPVYVDEPIKDRRHRNG